jgi:hypothetical protein
MIDPRRNIGGVLDRRFTNRALIQLYADFLLQKHITRKQSDLLFSFEQSGASPRI